MRFIGKKPLELELIFGPVKNWDSRGISKQFNLCCLADTVFVFKDLSSYRNRDVELQLEPINVKQIILAKRFFKLELVARDKWNGAYPEFMVPFGPCPKKMIFRYNSAKITPQLLRMFAEEQQIALKELNDRS